MPIKNTFFNFTFKEILIFIGLMLFNLSVFSKTIEEVNTYKFKNIYINGYFNDIELLSVYGYEENKLYQTASYKIVIKKAKEKKLNSEEILWTITGNDLPIDENTCLDLNIDICDPSETKYCYKNCATYGPYFERFDEANGDIYFTSSTINTGNAHNSRLNFVGNINTKIIKYLGMK